MAKTRLTKVKAGSRKGRKVLDRLVGRVDEVVDRKTRKRAAKIVDKVRRKGDRGLLRAVRKFDGFRAGSVEELRLAVEPVKATSK
ncbi:MAG: hypothetical protein R3234_05055, partial [Thermoanaerobaculia bacterium]|nr:hypothetical protein [Thermoanaerobaculia bacterium]